MRLFFSWGACVRFGTYIEPDKLLEDFCRLLEKVGLPRMRFHDLRHSAATILLGMGIHPKLVQELLGHSSMHITLGVYGHMIPSMHQDAMDKMNEVFQDD